MRHEAVVVSPATALAATANASPRRRQRRVPALVGIAVFTFTTSCSAVVPGGDAASDGSGACRGVVPPSDARIEWKGPSTAAEQKWIARWCATVGPVLLRAAAREPATRAIDRLAIVSWNVHVGSGDLVDLVGKLRRGELTGGAPVEQFVVLVQEAYRRDTAVPRQIPRGFPVPSRIAARTGRGPDIGHIADALGLAVLYVPSMRNGLASVDAEDRGNAILSTLDLQDPEVVELPAGHQRRAVAVATVTGLTSAAVAWRLRLVNVHLDTALAITNGGPFNARRRQVEALVAALDPSNPISTVVAGDFNTWRGPAEPALAFLRQSFPQSPAMPALPTWRGPFRIEAQLDYVFLRGSFATAAVTRVPSVLGSDHYPMLALVRF